jgi:hypothetical protein
VLKYFEARKELELPATALLRLYSDASGEIIRICGR